MDAGGTSGTSSFYSRADLERGVMRIRTRAGEVGAGVVVGLTPEGRGLVTLVALLPTSPPASRTRQGGEARMRTSGTTGTSGTTPV